MWPGDDFLHEPHPSSRHWDFQWNTLIGVVDHNTSTKVSAIGEPVKDRVCNAHECMEIVEQNLLIVRKVRELVTISLNTHSTASCARIML